MSDVGTYLGADGWYGIYAGGHPQTVPVAELLPLPPVEADPGRVPAVGRDGDLQLHSSGHNYGPGNINFYIELSSERTE